MDGSLVVIGITGLARAGKDTAATILGLHGGFTRIALADGIREAFAGLSGSTGELYKELTADHNYRRALQTFGTEAREAAGVPGLWVSLLLTKIYYLSEIHPTSRRRFVIPDVRYRFEESMIRHFVQRRRGRFVMLRIIRPGLESIAESGHSSEMEIGLISRDFEIVNDGTIPEFSGRLVGHLTTIGVL